MKFSSFKKKIKGIPKKSKEYVQALDRASKIRFSSSDLAFKLKFGYGVTKGLQGSSAFKKLSVKGQKKAFLIVDEECSRKSEWAPKEMPRLARLVEKRLKKEVNDE